MLRMVDRLIVMDKGKIRYDGPRDEVLAKLRASAQARKVPIQEKANEPA